MKCLKKCVDMLMLGWIETTLSFNCIARRRMWKPYCKLVKKLSVTIFLK